MILKLLGPFGIAGAALSLVLSILLGLQLHTTHHWEHEAATEKLAYQTEKAAFDTTVANYRTAAAKAHDADLANAARVKSLGAALNQERQTSYEARIADARARAERLQPHATAAAHPGSPGTADVSGVSNATGGADEAARQDGLSRGDRLTATEQAIQLDELIKWVKSVVGIDVNGKQ